jgi:hypothetical protein
LRKLGAIFFLTTFLFNLGGYYIVFWGLHLKSDHEIIKLIDTSAYSGSDEVIITIPLTLPYPIYQEGFSRVHGEFEYEGEHYKLVKQKMEDDMLVLVCIKDRNQEHLISVMSDFAKATNDLPAANQTSNLLGKLFKDFQIADLLIFATGDGWARDIDIVSFITPSFHADLAINVPPPKVS